MPLSLLLTLLLGAQPTTPRVYIVDGRAANAADTNPGTPEHPLKTIGAAAEKTNPGDTVVVRPGLYREAVRVRRSGTQTAPITYLAEPAGQAVVSGADPVTGWQRVPGDAPIYQAPWKHEFRINTVNGKPVIHHPENAPRWGRAEQAMVDGKQLAIARDLAELQKLWAERRALQGRAVTTVIPDPNNPLTWQGAFTADIDQQEMYLWLSDGSDPNGHQVEASSRGQTFGTNPWADRDGFHDVHIRGFVFRYGASFPQRAVVWLHGQRNVLEDCVIEQMSGSGVNVNGVMRRCIIRQCGQTGGAASGHGFANEQCLWEGNCWKPISRGWDAGGVKMARSSGGLFRQCVFRRNGGPGLWFDVDVSGVTVTECVFQDNEGSGLFVEISRDIQVIRNLAVGNAVGKVQVVKDADWSEAGIKVAESQNVLVAYNTCVDNKDGITFREQGPRPLDTPDYGTIPYHNRNDVVFGNVCAGNRGYQIGLWYDNAFFGWHPSEKDKYKTEEAWQAHLASPQGPRQYDPTRMNHVIAGNLLWAGQGQKLILHGVPWRPRFKEYADLASWTKETGFGAGSVVADPGFAEAARGDYRFRDNGPARMQALGWQQAPANVDAWMAAWLPKW